MRVALITLIAAAVALHGCDRDRDDDHDHEHDHEHQHDGHDAEHDQDDAGCGDEHSHENDARNGGKMIEIGDHFAWAEVLVDNEDGTITLWMWDGHVENPQRLKMKEIAIQAKLAGKSTTITLAAQADALTGETVGDTQRFVGKDDRLKGIETLSGTIDALDIKGSKFQKVAFTWSE